jgi:hypothetical protein
VPYLTSYITFIVQATGQNCAGKLPLTSVASQRVPHKKCFMTLFPVVVAAAVALLTSTRMVETDLAKETEMINVLVKMVPYSHLFYS